MDCEKFREGVTNLAAGGTDAQASVHVAGCPACTARLISEKRIVEAARLAQFEPSESLVARAYALMTPRPRLIARLVGSNLAASGMRRSSTERFSLHLQAGDRTFDLQYVPVKGGWQVLGRAPSAEWTVTRDGAAGAIDPMGRFRLDVPALDDSAFTLRLGDEEVEIPAAGELLERDA